MYQEYKNIHMMKSKKSLLAIAAMALFVSCSNEDDKSVNNEFSGIIENSNVEILLSTGGHTRGSIESDANGLFEAEGLGIFCLAKGKLGLNPDALDITWDLKSNPYAVWMDNVQSDAKLNENKTGTDIVWTDSQQRWYPAGNWYSYRFYGYYPYSENIKATKTQRIVEYTIDGTQDIIWGKTNVSDDSLAYCAKYFRSEKYANVVPSMNFEHKLMRLTFSCIPGKDGNGSIEEALKMGVKSIKITKVPTTANMIIADRENVDNEGVIVFDWNNLGEMYLLDSGDQPLGENYWVEADEVKIGQGVLVPVPTDPDFHYFIEVTLKDKEGREWDLGNPIELENQSGTFVPGKSYNVKMTIYGPKTVEVKGSLSQWEEDDSSIGGVTYE